MRRKTIRSRRQHFRVLASCSISAWAGALSSAARSTSPGCPVTAPACQHRADARMGVLHVINRVVVVLCTARSTSKVYSVSGLRLSRKSARRPLLVHSIRSRRSRNCPHAC